LYGGLTLQIAWQLSQICCWKDGQKLWGFGEGLKLLEQFFKFEGQENN
jgi:hypothetical protein